MVYDKKKTIVIYEITGLFKEFLFEFINSLLIYIEVENKIYIKMKWLKL